MINCTDTADYDDYIPTHVITEVIGMLYRGMLSTVQFVIITYSGNYYITYTHRVYHRRPPDEIKNNKDITLFFLLLPNSIGI